MKNADIEALAISLYESEARAQGGLPSWLRIEAEERDKWRDKAKDMLREVENRWGREFHGDF